MVLKFISISNVPVCFLFRFFEELNSGSLSSIDHSTSMAFLDWYHLLENFIDGSDSWKETCGSGHLHYRECPGDPLVTWKRGYSALFDILMVTKYEKMLSPKNYFFFRFSVYRKNYRSARTVIDCPFLIVYFLIRRL